MLAVDVIVHMLAVCRLKKTATITESRASLPNRQEAELQAIPPAPITLLSDSVAKCNNAESLQAVGCGWLPHCCSVGRSFIYWQVTHRAAGSDVITPSLFCKLTTLFTLPSFHLSTDISLKKGKQ
jgi:hypothetical protein